MCARLPCSNPCSRFLTLPMFQYNMRDIRLFLRVTVRRAAGELLLSGELKRLAEAAADVHEREGVAGDALHVDSVPPSVSHLV